jgi:hypothetical protein
VQFFHLPAFLLLALRTEIDEHDPYRDGDEGCEEGKRPNQPGPINEVEWIREETIDEEEADCHEQYPS